MASSGLLPVFVDTSLDTHLAIVVSPHDTHTIASLKRKFAMEHLLSFPALGPIIIEALMTHREGVEYRLSDYLPVSAVLDLSEGPRFLKALVATEAAALATTKKKHKRNASLQDATPRAVNLLEVPDNDAGIPVHEPQYIKIVPLSVKNLSHDSKLLEIPDENADPITEAKQCRCACGITKPVEEEARKDHVEKKATKDDTNKDQSSLEMTQMIGAVLHGVTPEKKKEWRKTEGVCSDLPSEIAPIIKSKPQVEDRNQVSQKEKDFKIAEKPGDTWSSSHEGWDTKKKKDGEEGTSRLLPCHECKTSCKNHISTTRIATEEGAIAERGTKLEGLSCSGNALVCKELVPPDKKKLLVLDINGLLADINSDYKHNQYADFRISGKLGFKRPFCDDFLKFCFANFEVGVWSSRMAHNLKSAVHHLFGEMKNKLLFCWDQSKCTATKFKTLENKPLFFKELKKLWEKVDPDLPWEKGQFTPSNTLLVDDSPCKASCNPPNTAIFPVPYKFENKEDNSLGRGGSVRVYLEKIAAAKDVPEFVKKNPFGKAAMKADPEWRFYLAIRHSCCALNLNES